MTRNKLIIILGPTAVGKTDYSIETALKYDSPIISCDSRQIYKEMTIGTAVPSAEQLAAVQHYFIHSHTVTDLYTAGKYELEALEIINRLFAEGHETLVMAGGSGFYVDALVNGLDDFPSADLELRNELMRRLKEEGVEELRMELKSLDPESYATIDIANGQRVVRALEVCLMTGKPFSSFKTSYDSSLKAKNEQPAPVQEKVETPAPVESAKPVETVKEYYGVQIMGLGRLLKNGDPALKGLEVQAVKSPDSTIYKYVVGMHSDRESAVKSLADIKKKFPEAFVVKVEGTNVSRLR